MKYRKEFISNVSFYSKQGKGQKATILLFIKRGFMEVSVQTQMSEFRPGCVSTDPDNGYVSTDLVV